jgi:hypothetical protein
MSSNVDIQTFDRRLVNVTLLIVVGLMAALFIPSDMVLREAAIRMMGDDPFLPSAIDGSVGKAFEPSELELEWLASDTKFGKRSYASPFGIAGFDDTFVNIVLSGQDMNQSIHRPERCLPSQGHKDLILSDQILDVGGGRTIVARKIESQKAIHWNGKETNVTHVQYYWFIGHESETSSHYQRTLLDIRDRLLGGYNQKWAYFAISGIVGGDAVDGGRTKEQSAREIERIAAKVYVECVLTERLDGPNSRQRN